MSCSARCLAAAGGITPRSSATPVVRRAVSMTAGSHGVASSSGSVSWEGFVSE